LAKSKKKKELSPELAAQAAAMKERLEQLAAERKERDAARSRGGNAGGGWSPGGVDPHQIRSGRRGNR
jgi:hypothetical protein